MNKIFWAREVSRGEEMRNMKEEDTGGDALRIGDLVRGGMIERGEEVKGDAQSFRAEVVSCGETFLGFERARNAAIAARFCAIFGIPLCGRSDFSYWALWALPPGLACCRHPS
jgi:hypothetical protein